MAQLPAAPVLYTPETHLSTADVNRIAVATAAKVLELEAQNATDAAANSTAVSSAASATPPTSTTEIKSSVKSMLSGMFGGSSTTQSGSIQDVVRAALSGAHADIPAAIDVARNAAVIDARARAQVSIDALKAELKARTRNAPTRATVVADHGDERWF